ncbi:MAG: hypothetical protein JSW71_03135 [Gemmatimonadota bacterium]|nr:MAG: hypothetical protein JSW71_03135 [Gemmatimonadota bacterium]
MRPSAALFLALPVLSVACSEQGTWAGTVTDSAGVTVVHNPAVGAWTAADAWTLEEELRIGAMEGDPEYLFGRIGSVSADSRGRIFVLDAQAQHVRVYSAAGRYEATVGGPGAGPGELGPEPAALFLGAGDTLLVSDLSNHRVNRYAPDGTSLGSIRLAFENGLPLTISAARSGVIAAQVRPLALPGQAVTDSLDALLMLDTDGAVIDTVMRFPSGRTLRLGGSQPEITVFAAEPAWQLTGAGSLCYGPNTQYRLELYARDGTLERVVTRVFSPRVIAEEDQEMMRSLFDEQLRATVPPQAFAQASAQVRDLVHFADHYPPFGRILIGPENSIWVQHIPDPSELTDEERVSWNFMEVLTGISWNLIEDIGAPDWDVFEADGRYLGTVTMPLRFSPRTIVDGKIYGLWRDELEVQYAVRLGIVGVRGTD